MTGQFPPEVRRRVRGMLMLAAGLGLLASAAQAAPREIPKPSIPMTDTGYRDQAVPDSAPNISGIWSRIPDRVTGSARVLQEDGTLPPMQDWVRKIYDERMAAEARGAPLFDPTAGCVPSGIPRMYNTNYPLEIIQTKDFVIFMHEAQHNFRTVRMNAEHPAKLTPTYMGHSVGHWENGDLIIDTVGLVPHTQIDEGGIVHSDKMHLIERWRRLNDAQMELVYTVDDPNAFTKPWSGVRLFAWTPDSRSLEYICEENNRNVPDANGLVHTVLADELNK